jgi:Icc-related predicted phosphoesterase
VRYLVASDLHYSLPQLDWIAACAGDFDAVVLAGDHLDLAGRAELNAQITLLSLLFARLADRTVVFANSGNHDLTARGTHGEKAAAWLEDVDARVATDGTCRLVGDDLVSVCAWWEGPVTRQAVEDQLARDAKERTGDGLWIWVYHSPPDQSPTSWSGKRHFGDDLLNDLAHRHQPDIVLAGHVHEAPYRDDGSWHDHLGTTLVLNAGRQPGAVPSHLVVDTGARTVLWSGLTGTEQITF